MTKLLNSIYLGASTPDNYGKASGVVELLPFELYLGMAVPSGKPKYIDVVLSGVSPLVLTNAIENGLNYLKLFGGTEQRNLPSEYTQVEYLESTGTQYIDTLINADSNLGYRGKVAFTTLDVNKYMGAIKQSGTTYYRNNFGLNNRPMWSAYYGTTGTTAINFMQDADTNTHTVEQIVDPANQTVTNIFDGTIYNDFTYENYDIGLNFYLFRRNGNSDSLKSFCSMKIYWFQLIRNGVLLRDYIPAKRDSDNVLGLYDLVSNTFFSNDGTGSFTAGSDVVPSPDTPMDIICNNGVVKARMTSGLPLGYTRVEYLESSGTQYFDLDYTWKSNSIVDVDFKSNKESGESFTCLLGAQDGSTASSYGRNYILFGQTLITQFNIPRESGRTLYLYDNGTVATSAPSSAAESYFTNDRVHYILNIASKTIQIGNRTWNASSVASEALSLPTSTLYLLTRNTNGAPDNECSKGLLYGAKIFEGNNLVKNLVPAKRNSDNIVGMYDTVSQTFLTNAGTGAFVAGNPVDDLEIYTDGTVETVVTKDSNNTVLSTATAQDLYAVGTYKDVQSVLDGAVTRNVGIKVLDGTEKWTAYNGGVYFPLGGGGSLPAATVVYCSHFSYAGFGILIANLPMGGFTIATNGNCSFKSSDTTTKADWVAWLADQYANGSPVIIVYPLATATTETVTPQPMNIQEGTNIVQITQASMDGLTMEVSYKAGVIVTITEVENAQLDNSVEVTING